MRGAARDDARRHDAPVGDGHDAHLRRLDGRHLSPRRAGVDARCSFCGKAETEVDALVIGDRACICNVCAALAKSPFATVAYCAQCRVVNGKHDPECEDASK